MLRSVLLIVFFYLFAFQQGAAQTERRGLRMLVVRTQAEAESLRARIKAGESFEALARAHSTDRAAAEGGYIGTFALEDLRPEFRQALASAGPDEVSLVVRTGDEFALLQWQGEAEQVWAAQNDAGLQAFQQKRYREAEEAFGAAVRAAEKFGPRDERLAESVNGLAETYRVQEKFADAEPLYWRILGFRWQAPEVLYGFSSLLGLAYFRDSQFADLLKKFDDEVSRAQPNESLYVAMASLLMGAELTAEAEALMQRAVQRFPDSRRVRYRLGELYRDAGQMRKALEAFEAASRMEGPREMDAARDRLQRAFIYQRIGGINTDLVRFDDALAAYQKALEITPDSAEARLSTGDLYLRRGTPEEALAEYTRVLSAQPDLAPAHSRLAELYLHLGRLSEAVSAAGKALQFDPKHKKSKYVRAMALIRSGQLAEGEAEMQEYRKLEMDLQASINRAREVLVTNRGAAALLLEGKSEEALATFRKGIDSHPDAAGIYLNLGMAQSKLGRHGDAVKTFRTMIDLGLGDHFLVHRSLARSYEALGDTKASQRHKVIYLQKMDAALEAALN